MARGAANYTASSLNRYKGKARKKNGKQSGSHSRQFTCPLDSSHPRAVPEEEARVDPDEDIEIVFDYSWAKSVILDGKGRARAVKAGPGCTERLTVGESSRHRDQTPSGREITKRIPWYMMSREPIISSGVRRHSRRQHPSKAAEIKDPAPEADDRDILLARILACPDLANLGDLIPSQQTAEPGDRNPSGPIYVACRRAGADTCSFITTA